jgi:hypothetical protein
LMALIISLKRILLVIVCLHSSETTTS